MKIRHERNVLYIDNRPNFIISRGKIIYGMYSITIMFDTSSDYPTMLTIYNSISKEGWRELRDEWKNASRRKIKAKLERLEKQAWREEVERDDFSMC